MGNSELIPEPQQKTTGMEQAEIAAKYGLAKWIFKRGFDFVKGRILEIGDGEGHVAKYCRREGMEVKVMNIDLKDELFNITYKESLGAFDLVYVLMNGTILVNSREAVSNSSALLKPEGCLISILPCQTALYEGLAQGIEEWMSFNRRYIRSRIGMHFQLEKIRFLEVLDHLPPFVSAHTEYEESVRQFEKTSTNDFVPLGLFAIVIERKL